MCVGAFRAFGQPELWGQQVGVSGAPAVLLWSHLCGVVSFPITQSMIIDFVVKPMATSFLVPMCFLIACEYVRNVTTCV